MAVSVDGSKPGELRLGTPTPLFASHALAFGGIARQQYVVLGNGEQFIINSVADDAHANPITVVVNWHNATHDRYDDHRVRVQKGSAHSAISAVTLLRAPK